MPSQPGRLLRLALGLAGDEGGRCQDIVLHSSPVSRPAIVGRAWGRATSVSMSSSSPKGGFRLPPPKGLTRH